MDQGRLKRRFEGVALTGHGVPAEALLALFDDLPAVELDEMVGDWAGACIATGHPDQRSLAQLAWVGKRVRARDDVDPLICLDADGRRFANPFWGGASLRRVEYRDVLTATMIYDARPVLEHFRRVDDGLLLGAMDRKGTAPPLLFHLRRLDGAIDHVINAAGRPRGRKGEGEA